MRCRLLFSLVGVLLLLNPLYAEDVRPCNDEWFEGEGTQYGGIAGSNGGNCGIYVEEGDFHHCAMNHIQYDSSSACGGCVRVLGPMGEITLKVVDRCPECKLGDIDLSTQAFAEIAQMKDGRIPIKWQFIPCDAGDDIKVLFAPGTSPYFFKALFYNLRYRIAKVEYKKSDGSYSEINREMYNYFVEQGGIDEDKTKSGPYTFRLTDVEGGQVLIENLEYTAGEELSTGVQFPELKCADCAGMEGGTAQIDNCGVCSGGTTGVEPNSSCKKDCIGYWKGSAYIDDCGFCVGGMTGGTPCGNGSSIDDLLSDDDAVTKIELFNLMGKTLFSCENVYEFYDYLSEHTDMFIVKLWRGENVEYRRMVGGSLMK
ncbi:MAG TPA: expansin EXLX1 family cellulose-binding protein [Paludibacteraceae bacterium]|nr:expansin EXLX1 family cellulose-binding protein [Paludibacteraceae bacterium]HQF50030.1 expansin EXLX1 family cellulose-binding protein [Paludibacteraceae bacterium]HQJ91022.1 expansin EXLX1 family cellulose-binding protein [Paludibacteraceae bacterium]